MEHSQKKPFQIIGLNLKILSFGLAFGHSTFFSFASQAESLRDPWLISESLSDQNLTKSQDDEQKLNRALKKFGRVPASHSLEVNQRHQDVLIDFNGVVTVISH